MAQPQAPDLGKAEALIREGKAEQAWRLLAPHEAAHAGRPDFDYLLGVAALQSGRPNLATFILERLLITSPGHAPGRLAMARSYVALGDRERAAREFRGVLVSDPSPATRALVQEHLERMQWRAVGRALDAYVELTLGRDSNVNAAATPGGIFAAEPLPARDGDGFSALGAGTSFSRALDDRHSLSGGADVKKRMHFDLDRFDSLAADLHMALHRRLGERDSLRLGLEHGEYDLDRSGFRRAQGASAQWSRAYGEQASLSLFGQGLRIRYRDAAVQDESSDLLIAGLRAARILDAAAGLQGSATFYLGRDDARADRVDGDRGLIGLGGTLSRRFNGRLEASAGLSYLHSDYRRENPAAGVRREDRYVAAELGLLWRLGGGWSLRPQLSRTHNRSNLPLTEYGRTEASVSLRRTWQ